MKTVIEMTRNEILEVIGKFYTGGNITEREVAFARHMMAYEREACAKVCEEFARKWWKIHCDSNLHYSSTLKAHQDFCALQAAIRARSNT